MGASQPPAPGTGHRYARPVPGPVGPRFQTSSPAPPLTGDGPWTWTLPAVPAAQLPLLLHLGRRSLAVETSVELMVPWTSSPMRLVGLLVGAGLAPVADPEADHDGTVRVRVVSERTLADTVGPEMRLLVCGINPSVYSADAGVGYARPGNRFWPAALAAGLVPVDRDPVAALAAGLGMTDFAKRATRTAAEVSGEEYGAGFARVTGLIEWLRPGAVCFVGLSGWRTVVDRHAIAGLQPDLVGGRPAYVMPSTRGLNARTPPTELVRHLLAAWDQGVRED
jgi:TDG/mug DNA glycosylase family protein